MTEATVHNIEPLGPAADDVRRKVLSMIATGELRPGQKLNAERELADDFGVSRSTLRQALTSLEESGDVRRLPGRGGGTFISPGKIDRDLSRIVGVPSLLRGQGFTAGTKLISASVMLADAATRTALGLSDTDHIFDVVRIRLADSQPISLEHARFPAELFPGLLERALGSSLYELMSKHYDTIPDEALEEIELVSATPDEAAILNVDIGAPLLSVTRTTMDVLGRKIEYSHDLFRGDRTRITVRTKGQLPRDGEAGSRGRTVELRGG
ncbi:MAG: GntR family transcriptional regulator [Actinomycetes bacterium]